MRARHLRQTANGAGASAALLLASLLVGHGTAAAQDLQNFRPATGSWNYLGVQGAETAPPGRLYPSLYVNHAADSLTLRDEQDELVQAVVEGTTTFELLGAYAPIEGLELGFDLPFAYVTGDGLGLLGKESGSSLGDLYLLPKLRLLGEPGSTFGLALTLGLGLPTGDTDRLTGDDGWTVHPRLSGELRHGRLRGAVEAGFRWRSGDPTLAGLELGNDFSYGVAGGYDLLDQRLRLIGELQGVTPLESVENPDDQRPLEARAALRWFTSWCGAVTLGGGLGLVTGFGSPDYRVLAGLAYGCVERDADHDGVADRVDRCPAQAEDKDGTRDEDGCPDLDDDGDGVADGADRCPAQAEDRDGFQDEDGCPDPDNDGDGVADAADRCPAQAEDRDGFQDEDGCPDPDNDQDGVLDGADRCPTEAETVNNVDDGDGCPEKELTQVVLTTEKIEILQKVHFDLSKTTIKPESFTLLDEVAGVLRAHPEIVRVRVEGHTDLTGNDTINNPLSQGRAEAVRAYLIQKGVAGTRLVAQGFGATRPLVQGTTDADNEQNRRVEFVIVESKPIQPGDR